MNWTTFWYYVMWTAMLAYFGLAIVVAIGGFFDVKRMFRRLDTAHAEASKTQEGEKER